MDWWGWLIIAVVVIALLVIAVVAIQARRRRSGVIVGAPGTPGGHRGTGAGTDGGATP